MWLLAFAVAWVVIRGFETVWGETRDRYVKSVGASNKEWHPRKVRRHARIRAGMHLLSEVTEGFPSLRRAWNEHWLTAQTERAEAAAAGHVRRKDLWARLDRAIKARQDAADAVTPDGTVPEPEPDAASTRPPLTLVPGGAVPVPETPAGTGTANGTPVIPETGKPAEPWTGDAASPDWDTTAGPAAAGATTARCDLCGDPGVPGNPLLPSGEQTVHQSHLGDAPSAYANGNSHESADHEGDPVPTDVENADTPFEGLQNVLAEQAKEARDAATHAQDELIAYAVTHGFDRDQAVMAQLQAIHDAAEAHAAAAEGAQRTLVANHADGAEYHGTGADADASAFRPA